MINSSVVQDMKLQKEFLVRNVVVSTETILTQGYNDDSLTTRLLHH